MLDVSVLLVELEPFQKIAILEKVEAMKKDGKTEKEIANAFRFSVPDFRTFIGSIKKEEHNLRVQVRIRLNKMYKKYKEEYKET